MRVESIAITWFRGSADRVALSTKLKSVVVYGQNGSGKSSFVDAVEYVLKSGRIGHLAHEYSGKHQEKGVINTHTPVEETTELSITFQKDLTISRQINRSGVASIVGTDSIDLTNWDYRRTVLRQDEVAAFIAGTKGGKYSALLPLLGLDRLEIAAENLRQLSKAVIEESKLSERKNDLQVLLEKRNATFGKLSDNEIEETFDRLHTKYCGDQPTTKGLRARCEAIESALEVRIAKFSAEQRAYLVLKEIAALNLEGHINATRSAGLKLAEAVEPLINEKLEILQSAGRLADKIKDETNIKCPACGREIPVKEFQNHVANETTRLREILNSFEIRKRAIAVLCTTLETLRTTLRKSDVRAWRDALPQQDLKENFSYVDGLIAETLRSSCGEDDLRAFETKLQPIITRAESASAKAPPDVVDLLSDRKTAQLGRALQDVPELDRSVTRSSTVLKLVTELENATRAEIRGRSQRVVDEISKSVQQMWAIVHPGEPIEDVQLYLPDDVDKAIDVRLRFYGVKQDSPRLTLSESYRNSLGLCIFLAMAQREKATDRPIFLDDVIVSLDRNHRGMLVELLEKEFDNRQILIFTHDREWYAELRQQLDPAKWEFKALVPYVSPEIGICWSAKHSAFGDARAQLKTAPEVAGNIARKIMDIDLSIRAQKLKLRLPYLRLEKNDHRMAHDFLSRLISDGPKCFMKKDGEQLKPHTEAVEAFREVDKLLMSWGNKASHTFDVVPNEAEKLINKCEAALQFFECSQCKKPVHKCEDANAGLVQCQCSTLQWRYGKA